MEGRRERSIWSFEGRIGRRTFIARSLLLVLADIVFALILAGVANLGKDGVTVGLMLYIPSMLILAWISIAMQVKRWHDLGMSGWMVLLNFTLITIPVFLIFFFCVRGTQGLNRFGSDPVRA